MKTFYNNKRKTFNNSTNRRSNFNRSSKESSYIPQTDKNGNTFRKSNKNFKDQHSDYLNKAIEAKGHGDEVLEQFYLQYAEHCIRQIESAENSPVSKKINKAVVPKNKNIETDKVIKSDFDDLANQLA